MQVRFFLKLPDEIAVVAGVHLPVDLSNFVSRDVLSVLGKLATASLGGRAVLPREQAVDDCPRQELQMPDPLHHPWIDDLLREGSTPCAGTAGGLKSILERKSGMRRTVC